MTSHSPTTHHEQSSSSSSLSAIDLDDKKPIGNDDNNNNNTVMERNDPIDEKKIEYDNNKGGNDNIVSSLPPEENVVKSKDTKDFWSSSCSSASSEHDFGDTAAAAAAKDAHLQHNMATTTTTTRITPLEMSNSQEKEDEISCYISPLEQDEEDDDEIVTEPKLTHIQDGFINEEPSPQSPNPPHPLTPPTTQKSKKSMLTEEDFEIMRRLDTAYIHALEEREVGWTARYNSVRQSACFSITFMFTYLALGTIFFQRHTDWDIGNSLLFSIYTITTVGYGNHYIPRTERFQVFTVFYILVGIAALTVVVAQVYQCVALEASRAQYARDRNDLSGSAGGRNRNGDVERGGNIGGSSHGSENSQGSSTGQGQTTTTTTNLTRSSSNSSAELPASSSWRAMLEYHANITLQSERDQLDIFLDGVVHCFERTKHFLRYNQIGRGVSVLLPFAGLILIGAIVVGPIEGWTAVESLYFSVVSLTTVGFGDYHPSHTASVWFCVFWLPFSVGFMSLYLGSVAHFYIRLSNNNIQRLERTMRRRIKRAKERAEKERAEAFERAKRAAGQSSSAQIQFGGEDDDVKVPLGPPQDIPEHLVKNKRRRKGFQSLPSADESGGGDDSGGVGGSYVSKLANMTSGGTAALFGSPEAAAQFGNNRREQIMKNAALRSSESEGQLERKNNEQTLDKRQQQDNDIVGHHHHGGGGKEILRPRGTTMATMKDILRAVHAHVMDDIPGNRKRNSKDNKKSVSGAVSSMILKTDMLAKADAVFMSLKSNSTMGVGMTSGWKQTTEKKPPFALRVLVQERMAEIVATDIAGYQSHVEIKENTLSVTIDRLKSTADKWMIPRRARKAFRAVAFEALYFVGEHGLITRGADALFDLTPFEFHGLFGPLLAAMGDADTMEGWLARTHILAGTDLKKIQLSSEAAQGFEDDDSDYEDNPQMKNVRKELDNQRRKTGAVLFPSSNVRRSVPGNAFSNHEKKTFRRPNSNII